MMSGQASPVAHLSRAGLREGEGGGGRDLPEQAEKTLENVSKIVVSLD